MGNPHLSIFQPIDAAPQRLYALDKHLKAAADNHNTSGPSLYSRFYGTCRGGFCRGGGSPFRDSTSSAHSEHSPLSSPISILLEILPRFQRLGAMWDAVERAFQSFLRFYRVVILNALPLNALPFQSFLRFYSKCIPAERVFERMPSFQSFLRFYRRRHGQNIRPSSGGVSILLEILR